jgi:tetratricopeptide (TPR) repeat protein
MAMFIALVLGQVYRALGQLPAAERAHLAAMALNEQVKSAAHTQLIGAELCTDCALAGRWEEAARHAREALAQRNYAVLPLVISARWPETEALLRAGEVELAGADARRWGELVGHIPRLRLPHVRSLAVLAEWEGDKEQAIAYLEEANVLSEEIGLPGERWQILARLGELYQTTKDNEQSNQALVLAAEIVQALVAEIEEEGLRAAFLAAARIDLISNVA